MRSDAQVPEATQPPGGNQPITWHYYYPGVSISPVSPSASPWELWQEIAQAMLNNNHANGTLEVNRCPTNDRILWVYFKKEATTALYIKEWYTNPPLNLHRLVIAPLWVPRRSWRAVARPRV